MRSILCGVGGRTRCPSRLVEPTSAKLIATARRVRPTCAPSAQFVEALAGQQFARPQKTSFFLTTTTSAVDPKAAMRRLAIPSPPKNQSSARLHSLRRAASDRKNSSASRRTPCLHFVPSIHSLVDLTRFSSLFPLSPLFISRTFLPHIPLSLSRIKSKESVPLFFTHIHIHTPLSFPLDRTLSTSVKRKERKIVPCPTLLTYLHLEIAGRYYIGETISLSDSADRPWSAVGDRVKTGHGVLHLQWKQISPRIERGPSQKHSTCTYGQKMLVHATIMKRGIVF